MPVSVAPEEPAEPLDDEQSSPLARYLVAVLAVVAGAALRLPLQPLLGSSLLFITFFPAVFVSAWYGALGPGLLTTLLSALVADYFFDPPPYALAATPVQILRDALFVGAGVLASWLANLLHRQRRAVEVLARQREELLRAQLAAEHRAREREARFRDMADAAPLMIWHGADGLDRDWFNRGWREFTGRLLEEEAGQGWLQGVHAEDRPRCAAESARARAAGEAFEVDYRLRRADGTERWVADRGAPRRAGAGEVTGYVGSVRDIEERRAHELERDRLLAEAQAARAAAEAASRSKDEFLAAVSHAVRDPLNAIVGWAHLLRRGALDARDTERALETIERSAVAPARLIDSLLDTSRLVAGDVRLEQRPVDLATVVASALAATSRAAAVKGVALESRVHPVGLVQGDAGRLQQALQELLDNAVRFTPAGGRIELRLAQRHGEAEIALTDTGVGISSESLSQIFDAFRRLEDPARTGGAGMGLGLTIARRIVELHGGDVRAASPGPDCGTTVMVRLPLAGRPSPAPDEAPPSDETSALRGVKVLVVDDDPASREGLSRLLELHGAEIVAAASVADAFACLTSFLPDVVLSDLDMPERDGYDLIRELRTWPPGAGGLTPAAAVSAHALDEVHRRAVEAGFDRHLSKPIDPEAVVAVVADLARWRER